MTTHKELVRIPASEVQKLFDLVEVVRTDVSISDVPQGMTAPSPLLIGVCMKNARIVGMYISSPLTQENWAWLEVTTDYLWDLSPG